MQVFVKDIGTGSTISIYVEGCNTIQFAKTLIKSQTKIPEDQQTLIFQGKILEDLKTLEQYGVKSCSYLHFSAQVFGVFTKKEKCLYCGTNTSDLTHNVWVKVRGMCKAEWDDFIQQAEGTAEGAAGA